MTSYSESFKIAFESNNFVVDNEVDKTNLLPQVGLNLNYLPIKFAKIRATGEDVKTVIEIAFDKSKLLLGFEPGDTISILPENNYDEVDRLLCRIGMDKLCDNEYQLKIDDQRIEKVKLPKHVPLNGSLRHCFRHYIDIRRFLSKKLIDILGKYTGDENERTLIEKICKEKGLYSNLILEPNLSILDFLEKFPSCKPSVEILMEHLPQLSPRPYSVCNSSKADNNVIKICFSIISFKNKRKGLTSGWLESLIENFSLTNNQTIEENLQNMCKITNGSDYSELKYMPPNIRIPIYLKQSKFHLPADLNPPILMICNGTGISPFIGFLEEIEQLKIINPQFKYGSTSLYFGCRYSTRDFLYKDEINKFLAKNVLNTFHGAYSRENKTPSKYVQDNLYSNEKEISEVLDSHCTIFVCGSNVMIKQVELFFIKLLMKIRHIAESDAKLLIKDLKKSNHYIIDIWE